MSSNNHTLVEIEFLDTEELHDGELLPTIQKERVIWWLLGEPHRKFVIKLTTSEPVEVTIMFDGHNIVDHGNDRFGPGIVIDRKTEVVAFDKNHMLTFSDVDATLLTNPNAGAIQITVFRISPPTDLGRYERLNPYTPDQVMSFMYGTQDYLMSQGVTFE